MARVTYSDLIGKLNRYEVIISAAKRARSLSEQASKNLLKVNAGQHTEKVTVMALREIAAQNERTKEIDFFYTIS